MKFITIAAAVTITVATLSTTTALAQVSTATSRPKAHVAPRTNYTGGFPFGFVREDPRHHDGRRHHHRRGHRDREVGYLGYGGDGDGYVDTIPMSDEPGFFSNGGSVTFDGVRPIYEYDRSYPYEHYQGQAVTGRPTVTARVHCQVQNVRDEGSGREVAVRVCRSS